MRAAALALLMATGCARSEALDRAGGALEARVTALSALEARGPALRKEADALAPARARLDREWPLRTSPQALAQLVRDAGAEPGALSATPARPVPAPQVELAAGATSAQGAAVLERLAALPRALVLSEVICRPKGCRARAEAPPRPAASVAVPQGPIETPPRPRAWPWNTALLEQWKAVARLADRAKSLAERTRPLAQLDAENVATREAVRQLDALEAANALAGQAAVRLARLDPPPFQLAIDPAADAVWIDIAPSHRLYARRALAELGAAVLVQDRLKVTSRTSGTTPR